MTTGGKRMTWITTISYEAAEGALKKLYDRIKGPDNNVDNIMLAHSLRPHTMTYDVCIIVKQWKDRVSELY